MNYKPLFNDKEWDLFRSAPFNVQVLVSKADDERELEEIGPLLDILMSYSGNSFIEEVFQDTFIDTDTEEGENRLLVESPEALKQITAAVELIKEKTIKNLIPQDTLNVFCDQLLKIAEETAEADIEGLEDQEQSIIRLLKKKFN